MEELKEALLHKIKNLSDSIWEQRVQQRQIDDWLDNFNDGDKDTTAKQHIHALHLLSQFMYFGDRQLRELLKALYRDLYQYPIIEQIRKDNADTTDLYLIQHKFKEELQMTRFLGIGNPSESGSHLLLYFRQENELNKNYFISSDEIFIIHSVSSSYELKDSSIKRYVFIDDFCGSGTQAVEYYKYYLSSIKEINRNIRISYYMLISTKDGKEYITNNTKFDEVETIFELDSSYKCFANESRYFRIVDSPEIDKDLSHHMCNCYGSQLIPDHPLGYKDSQLLIGFHHNVPGNTLPIIWYDKVNKITQKNWKPIFKRYSKIGG